MAQINVLAIAKDVSFRGLSGNDVTLAVSYTFARTSDGVVSAEDAVEVTLIGNSTAAQWKTAMVTALKNAAAVPAGNGDTFVITRLIGLLDIATVANP